MTKQEQIEEIKRNIKKALEFDCSKGKCKTCKHKNEDNCEIPLITDYLIEQGYQKLPEDAVILTKEEYIDLSRNYVKEQKEQAVKEFTEKLKEEYRKLEQQHINRYDSKRRSVIYECKIIIEELLKEYEE